ncbi:MAG: DNA double-strand break repair nuclease NurA, partial [Anaerolineales bacterium]
GATDLWLFEQILGKHERSAVFSLQSKSAEKYTGSISIRFFYLNVGNEKKSKVARVDIPAWVANDKKILSDLHSALIEQSKIMGNEPFPYLLHRAHEIAVITHREKEEIDRMLSMQIQNNNGELGRISGKQSAKNLQGKTRR